MSGQWVRVVPESTAKLSVLEWAQERLENSERIAELESGAVRDGWLEDVAYWREIVSLLTPCAIGRFPEFPRNTNPGGL